jgi:hypothetical protein
MSRLPHCLDNRLTDGGKIASLTRRPRFIPRNLPVLFSATGWVNQRNQSVKLVSELYRHRSISTGLHGVMPKDSPRCENVISLWIRIVEGSLYVEHGLLKMTADGQYWSKGKGPLGWRKLRTNSQPIRSEMYRECKRGKMASWPTFCSTEPVPAPRGAGTSDRTFQCICHDPRTDQATSSTPSYCLWNRRRHTATGIEGKGYLTLY